MIEELLYVPFALTFETRLSIHSVKQVSQNYELSKRSSSNDIKNRNCRVYCEVGTEVILYVLSII
jgi:hypothetical protein